MATEMDFGVSTRAADNRRPLMVGLAVGAIAAVLIMTAGVLLLTGDDSQQSATDQQSGEVADLPEPQAASLTDSATDERNNSEATDDEAGGTEEETSSPDESAPASDQSPADGSASTVAESADSATGSASTTTSIKSSSTSEAGSQPPTTTAAQTTSVPETTSVPKTTAPPKATEPPKTTVRPTTTARPSNNSPIAELERQWAANRKVVVDQLIAGGYGVGDDGILRGPGGLRVDLNKCPTDWSNTRGVDTGVITIGFTSPLSGALASYSGFGQGMGSYIDYVNDNGGVAGRQIELLTADDSYVATITIEQIEYWLTTRRQPFAITTLGSPNGLAVQDMLNDACIPHPFAISAHPGLNNPVDHPFTSGLPLSYRTEAILWGEWIRRNLSEHLPVTVGSLVMDNDFGLTYHQAFEDWAKANPGVVSSYQSVPHDPAAPTVTNEMTTIAVINPDVFISMTAGNPCLLAVQEANAKGLTATAKASFTPSVCKYPAAYMSPAGDAADGFLSVKGGILDPANEPANSSFGRFVNTTLKADGLQLTELHGQGFGLYGWTYVEALRIAAELPGGLSRSNLVLAMWGLDLAHPLASDGVRLRTDGPADPFPFEGSTVNRWNASTQRWVEATSTIDVGGKTPACRWTSGIGCR